MRLRWIVLVVLLAGCPRDLSSPERPPGQACVSDFDCFPDGSMPCGAVRACVDRVCEADPSRVRPCP